MLLFRFFALLVLGFSLSACDPTWQTVVDERSEKIDAFSTELQALKGSLPEVPADSVKFQPLDAGAERPYYHIKRLLKKDGIKNCESFCRLARRISAG
jgi:hypothetical protein